MPEHITLCLLLTTDISTDYILFFKETQSKIMYHIKYLDASLSKIRCDNFLIDFFTCIMYIVIVTQNSS